MAALNVSSTSAERRDRRGSTSVKVQLVAVAWVRWRLFLNSLRRKGGKSDFVAGLFLYPLYALIAIGPVVASGFAGYAVIHQHQDDRLALLLWAIASAWTFFMASTAVAPHSLDLSLLLRFPMRLRTYLVTRFFFGLLAPPNVVGVLALVAVAIGVGVARPSAFAWAALVLFTYALMMVLLLRVCLLWLDRWLAQRRTREVVAVFFALVFVGFQFINIEVQTRMRTGHVSPTLHRLEAFRPLLMRLKPFLAVLPPSLAATSITSMIGGRTVSAAVSLAGVLAFAAVVLCLFAHRLRSEFRGEDFSEAPARMDPAVAVVQKHPTTAQRSTDASQSAPPLFVRSSVGRRTFGLPSGFVALCEKEVRMILRGPSMVMTVAMPLVLAAYAGRLGGPDYAVTLALAYTLLAMLPLVYNSLGADGSGVQLYLLSPTPLRHVFLAKNVVHCTLIALVGSIACGVILRTHRSSAEILICTFFWFFGVLFANLTLGNHRSLYAPVKFDMGKLQRRQAASQFSMLMIVVLLAIWLGVGYVALWLEHRAGFVWIAPWVMLALAAASFAIYQRSLNRIGRMMLGRRDAVIAALCKA